MRKPRAKKVYVILGVVMVVVVLIGAAILYFWNAMQQPLYTPGMVRAGRNLRASLVPPPQLADEQFWTVESDIRLYHFEAGSGTPVLVVHGGPGMPYAQAWPGLAPLTDRYRFVYYDQRGCGRSTRPLDRFASTNYYENMQTLDKTLGIGAQVADIERIRQILGEERLILVGHSFGGFLASLYAAEFPEHVRALILIAPAGTLVMPAADSLYDQVKARLPEDMQAPYADYLKRTFDYNTIFAKSDADLAALNAEFSPYYAIAARRNGFDLPATQAGVQNGGWMVQAMYFSMGTQHDYRAALAAVTAPALILHGASDLQTEATSRVYADALPEAQFKVIAGAGHFVFEDQPDAFAQAVGEFLAGVPR